LHSKEVVVAWILFHQDETRKYSMFLLLLVVVDDIVVVVVVVVVEKDAIY